jgi:translation initiation factor IF-3
MRGVRGLLLSPHAAGQGEAQGGHISVEPRINERIRVPEVRLVGPNGEQVGIVALSDALRLAQESDLDLVEVAPMARPPVAKLMDYGKFKYESALKARESRKNQAQTVIKEIKLRPKIDPHDYGTKKGHVERFLRQGDKVKVTIMFRGREQSRPELGFRLLQRLAADVEELGFVESQPKQDGRNMIMVIGPHRRKSEARAERAAHASERASARQRGGGAAAAQPAAAQPAAAEPAADGQPAGREPAETAVPARRAAAAGQPGAARQQAGPAQRDESSAGRAAPRPPAAARPQPAAGPESAPAPRPPATPRPSPPRPAPPRATPAGISPRPGRPAAARAQAETAAGRDA